MYSLLQLGQFRNVRVREGDGYQGWPEHAPFDAIVVTAAAPEIPKTACRTIEARRPPRHTRRWQYRLSNTTTCAKGDGWLGQSPRDDSRSLRSPHSKVIRLTGCLFWISRFWSRTQKSGRALRPIDTAHR